MKKDKLFFLIQKVKEKNNSAEEKLYNFCKKELNKYLNNKTYNNTNNDDIVSEAIIKIFNNINEFDEKKSSFKTWIINILKNTEIDFYRKKNNYVLTSSSPNNFQIDGTLITTNNNAVTWSNVYSDDVITTVNTTSNFELNDSIEQISNTITSGEFNLLNMHYTYCYNYCEIGQEYNITSSTVSNKINYIKTKIKKRNNKNNLL